MLQTSVLRSSLPCMPACLPLIPLPPPCPLLTNTPTTTPGGALEDLLPTLPESDLDLPSHLLPSGSKGALLGTGLHTVPSALARGPTSQFPLFSETAGMTQAGPGLPKESINKATTMVLQVGLTAALTGPASLLPCLPHSSS